MKKLGHDLEKIMIVLHDEHKLLFSAEGQAMIRLVNQHYSQKEFEYSLRGTKSVPAITDQRKLIEEATSELAEVIISRPQISDTKTRLESMGDGEFRTRETTIGLVRAASAAVECIPNIVEAIQNRTFLTRQVIFDVLSCSDIFKQVPKNPQQVIDEVAIVLNRIKKRLAVGGIKYEKTGDSYDMRLFENRELEAYLYDTVTKSGAVKVESADKTVYDYVDVDSSVEYEFMQSLESDDHVQFYIKLPSWFKIDTPVGSYNPDWAVVLQVDKRIYFVAETKGTDDRHDASLRDNEKERVLAGQEHFNSLGIPYVGPVTTLGVAIKKLAKRKSKG